LKGGITLAKLFASVFDFRDATVVNSTNSKRRSILVVGEALAHFGIGTLEARRSGMLVQDLLKFGCISLHLL
jgi:hypothetical protein